MNEFIRDDGAAIAVVPGFRERLLSYRAAVSPRADWSEADYEEAARKKWRRFERIAAAFTDFNGAKSPRLLDVGCGDGSNCILFAATTGANVSGIDLSLPLFSADDRGERTRRTAALLAGAKSPAILHDRLRELPLTFEKMDATRMTFPDATFDFVMSRSAMEHVKPVESALAEMVRVTKPGGLIYLSVDPFYWVRGCHKRGVIDIPWAHARLSDAELRRFVLNREDERAADARCERWRTLNRLTLAQWQTTIRATGCRVLSWQEDDSAIGAELLNEFPDVLTTLLPGVTQSDLLHERIKVWLQRV